MKKDVQHLPRALIARMHHQHAEYLLTEYHKQAGNAAEGRALLAECLTHATSSREYFDKYFSDTDDDSTIATKASNLQLLAIIYSINRDFDRARPLWQHLIDMHEAKLGDIKSRDLRELYFNAGVADFDSENYESAISRFGQYLAYLTDDDGHSPQQAQVAARYIQRAMGEAGAAVAFDPDQTQELIQRAVKAISDQDGDGPIVIRFNDTNGDSPVVTLNSARPSGGFSNLVNWLYMNNVKSPMIDIVVCFVHFSCKLQS